MELFSTTHHCPDHFSILALFDSAVERRVMRSWKRPRFIRIRQVERSGEVRLRKVRCAVCLRKFLSPSSWHFECWTRSVAFSRASLLLSLPPPVPPVIRPFSIFKLLASHHSQQQTRSIDFDDLDRKKSTGRTLARVS